MFILSAFRDLNILDGLHFYVHEGAFIRIMLWHTSSVRLYVCPVLAKSCLLISFKLISSTVGKPFLVN